MMDDKFRNAEDEYFRLRGRFSAGRITREQFDAALRALMIQDAQGHYWLLGSDSGKWFMHNGQIWVESNPYAPPAAPTYVPPPPPIPAAPNASALVQPQRVSPQIAPTVSAAEPSAITNALTTTWNNLSKRGWRGWLPLAIILIYVVLTRNITALVIGIAIVFVIRRFAPRIDVWLAPVWPLRDQVPHSARRWLAWILPALAALLIATVPLLYALFAWLPFPGAEGPAASVFTFSTLIAAFIGYVFMREPQLGNKQ